MSFEFKNHVEVSGNYENEIAILLLHGFPAEPIRDISTEKNIDFAKFLSSALKINCYVHHYAGLGRSLDHEFTFTSSINDSVDLYDKLKSRYKEVLIVGHSWGGFVALQLMHKRKIENVLLQSPFWMIPERSILSPVLDSLFSEIPYVRNNRSTDFFLDEFESFSKLDIENLKFSHGLILHPESDNEVPFTTSLELIKRNSKFKLEKIDTDHGFWLNRHLLFDRALKFFS